MEVHVLVGDPGTGKSRKARERHPDLYTFDNWEKVWWDGYCGQDAILLDDFYGQCKPYVLQRWLDGHDVQVQVRNGTRWARWTTVYITSNTDPSDWYPNVPDVVRQSIIDRLTSIVQFTGASSRPGPVRLTADEF